MYEVIDIKNKNIVGLKIYGDITKRQRDRIIDLMKSRVKKTGKIRLLILFEPRTTMDHESILENLNFARAYSEYIEKMAVVGDRAWEKTWIYLFGLFASVDTEYFGRSEWEKAVQWLV